MGGIKNIFSSPKEPVIDYDKIASDRKDEERKKNLERQNRGMDSTIKTSYTGVLGINEDKMKRKKLLGE